MSDALHGTTHAYTHTTHTTQTRRRTLHLCEFHAHTTRRFRVGRPAGQGEATAEVEEARARLWADVPYESLRASHGVYFFWRETAAQHFATADGLWQVRPGLGSERLPQTACRPLDATAGAVQTRLSERVRAAVPPGMRLLPLFAASQAAWRAHIERHTEHGRKVRGTDCTHFCEPCALFDDVNGRLVEALERAGASRRA